MDFSDIHEVETLGYIDKNKILEYVSEEEIFELVLGYKPIEYQYLCSPLREDKNPGCWFERKSNGKLIFIDYADPFYNKQDCFDFVKRFFNLSNFYQTLLFIKETLIDGKDLKRRSVEKPLPLKEKKEKKPFEIYIKARNYIQSDRLFWFNKYGITRKQLEEDKVFPVSKYVLKNTRKGDFFVTVSTNCYAYKGFEKNKTKLYFPFRKGKGRFITNCDQNDIGCASSVKNTRQLVITKSYKDCRVLRNLGVNCIWFQNEGMIPDKEMLVDFFNNHNFEDIVIFFDNDETGIIASEKVKGVLNNFVASRTTTLPVFLLSEGVKDASDLYCEKGKKALIEFLKENKIEYELQD